MYAASMTSSPSAPMKSVSEKKMGQSGGTVGQLGAETRTVVQERLTTFLIGLYPVKTTENVAADTGISSNTVSKWLDRGSAPSAWALLRLLDAYGAEFVCAVMDRPPAWAVQAAREQKRERLQAQISALQSQIDGGK